MLVLGGSASFYWSVLNLWVVILPMLSVKL